MKLQRYEKELLGLKDRITLLEELIEKEKADKNDGYPKNGEGYWYIGQATSWEVVVVMWTEWGDSSIDKYYWDFCHGSTDKAKVEWTIKHIELINEIKKYTRPFKNNEENWYIFRGIRLNGNYFLDNWELSASEITVEYGYFNSREEIKKVIEQLNEEYILRFLFEPRDGNYKAVLEWFADWKNEETEMPF